MSLRHQLSTAPIRVVEIIPPAVNTDLGGPGLHTFGVPIEEFLDAVLTGGRGRRARGSPWLFEAIEPRLP